MFGNERAIHDSSIKVARGHRRTENGIPGEESYVSSWIKKEVSGTKLTDLVHTYVQLHSTWSPSGLSPTSMTVLVVSVLTKVFVTTVPVSSTTYYLSMQCVYQSCTGHFTSLITLTLWWLAEAATLSKFTCTWGFETVFTDRERWLGCHFRDDRRRSKEHELYTGQRGNTLTYSAMHVVRNVHARFWCGQPSPNHVCEFSIHCTT